MINNIGGLFLFILLFFSCSNRTIEGNREQDISKNFNIIVEHKPWNVGYPVVPESTYIINKRGNNVFLRNEEFIDKYNVNYKYRIAKIDTAEHRFYLVEPAFKYRDLKKFNWSWSSVPVFWQRLILDIDFIGSDSVFCTMTHVEYIGSNYSFTTSGTIKYCK